MGPIDYTALQPQLNIAQQFGAGFNVGNAIQQSQFQQQEQAFQLQQQQAALQQMQAQRQAVSQYLQKPTADGASALALQFPAIRESAKQAWDQQNTQQQQSTLKDLSTLGVKLSSGDTDGANQLLQSRIDMMKARGQDPSQYLALQQKIQTDPNHALGAVYLAASAHPDGTALINNIAKIGEEQRAQQLQPTAVSKAIAEAGTAQSDATIKAAQAAAAPTTVALSNQNVASEIQDRAARQQQARDQLTTETQLRMQENAQKYGQLPDSAVSLVNTSVEASVKAEQQVSQLHDVANRVESLGDSWGKFGSANEARKAFLGSEDEVTAIRKEVLRLTSQQTVKLLPPGPASDKDVALAREGFLSSTANPKTLADGMRALARLSAYDAAANSAKAEWVGANKSLTKATTDLSIDGIRVSAGTTFPDFARQYVAKKADSLDTQAKVATRGYLKYATPQTAPVPDPVGGVVGGD